MKTRGMVLAVAFMLAATATLAVFMYVRGVREDVTGGGKTVSVIVAKEDLPAGTVLDDLITEGKLETSAVPEDQVVEGAITEITALEGQETSFPIVAGEQITTARLRGSARQLPGGALGIPSGYVGITLPIDSPRLVGAEVKRGDHVQMLAHFKDAGTYTIVSDAQVLKVDATDTLGAAATDAMVTLALKPRDSQRVVFAQNEGTVWFVLVPPNERGQAQAPFNMPQVVD